MAGNLTLTSITTQKNISPFTASFAPRNVAPTLVGTFVEENVANTILYNSYRYSLQPAGAQFTLPTHVGFIPPSIGGTPELELSLTFATTQQIPVSQPKAIILVIPIFSAASQGSYDAYVKQFIDSDKYPAASLQTIFFKSVNDTTQTSISYNTSIQTTDDNKKPVACVGIRVFYYPNGIRLTGQDFYTFKTVLTKSNSIPIGRYITPTGVTNGRPIVINYNESTNQILTVAQNTSLPVTQLNIAEIGNKLEYFQLPMSLSSTRDFSSSCPYYKTTEYKCVPFDRLKDLSGNTVVPGVSLADVITGEDKINAENSENSATIKNLFIYFAIAIGIAAVVIGLGMLVRYLTNKKIPVAGAAAGAAAAGAAAGAAAAGAAAAGAAAGAAAAGAAAAGAAGAAAAGAAAAGAAASLAPTPAPAPAPAPAGRP